MAELALQTVLRIKTTVCITCGCVIGMQDEYYDRRLDDHKNFHCPNGHSQYFSGESEAEKNARLLRLEQQRHQATLERANEDRAAKEKLERKLKRVGRGTCPECNRSFQNLARHMHCKHGGAALTFGKRKLP
jgi:HPt (histidine-containing phosphotransfer) domain-containing protein